MTRLDYIGITQVKVRHTIVWKTFPTLHQLSGDRISATIDLGFCHMYKHVYQSCALLFRTVMASKLAQHNKTIQCLSKSCSKNKPWLPLQYMYVCTPMCKYSKTFIALVKSRANKKIFVSIILHSERERDCGWASYIKIKETLKAGISL